MKYYSIQNSLNKKVLGHYPQVKDVIYNCHVSNDPLFIDRFYFEKINVKPIVANPILYTKSKNTDLILTLSAMGFSFTQLISGKLKSILEKNKKTGIQFIQCSVYKGKQEYKDYWLLNPFQFNQEYIDFKKSTIIYEKQSEDYNTTFKVDKIHLDIKNLSDFIKYIELAKVKAEMLLIEKLSLADNINDDFFILKHVSDGMFFVSEKLKKEIEISECTGIEFKPIELSYNEWSAPNGEREKIYGKTY